MVNVPRERAKRLQRQQHGIARHYLVGSALLMEIGDKEMIGFSAALFGWLGGVWSVARKVGKFEEHTATTLVEHAKKIAENTAEIEAIKKDHNEDMESVRAFFQTAAGGQKFMTFPDHDLICSRNNRVMVSEMQHLTAAVKILTEQSAETGRKVSDMAVDIAVMKAEMKKL